MPRRCAAEVPVTLHRYDGLIHAFVKRVDQFDAAREAIQEIGNVLRQQHSIHQPG